MYDERMKFYYMVNACENSRYLKGVIKEPKEYPEVLKYMNIITYDKVYKEYRNAFFEFMKVYKRYKLRRFSNDAILLNRLSIRFKLLFDALDYIQGGIRKWTETK